MYKYLVKKISISSLQVCLYYTYDNGPLISHIEIRHKKTCSYNILEPS